MFPTKIAKFHWSESENRIFMHFLQPNCKVPHEHYWLEWQISLESAVYLEKLAQSHPSFLSRDVRSL